MAIAVAILVAVLAGAVLVYWFYLRKPAKKAVPPVAPTAPTEDEVEITEEELASLKEIPTLKKDLGEIKAMLQELTEPKAEEEPEPPKEEWEEVEVKPGLILKMRKNGHAEPVAVANTPPPAPKETMVERLARGRAIAKANREARKQAQEGP